MIAEHGFCSQKLLSCPFVFDNWLNELNYAFIDKFDFMYILKMSIEKMVNYLSLVW